MADLRVTLPAPVQQDPTRQARLIGASATVVLPWWPNDIEFAALSYVWTEQPRPGRAPLLLLDSRTLPEVQIGFMLAARPTAYVDDAASIAPIVTQLRTLETDLAPVQLMLASRDLGRWRILDLSITELDHGRDGSPLRADVSMTLKIAQDASAPIGPVAARKPTKVRT